MGVNGRHCETMFEEFERRVDRGYLDETTFAIGAGEEDPEDED